MSSLIRPFAGLRPSDNRAADVIAPPYDVLNSAEARQRAHNKPDSFLHISKPEIDLPEEISPYDEQVYAKGAENLQRLISQHILQQDPADYYYVYRLTMGDHQQTGIVAAASVAAYVNNRIRKHEFTRPDKEQDRIRQIDVSNAQTGPVILAYRNHDAITQQIMTVTQADADVDVTADDHVRHQLWVIRDHAVINQLSEHFNQVDCLYIADGHHRSAAAAKVAELRHATEDAHANYFLSVIFPSDQLQILSYNRVVKDLAGLSSAEFVQKLQQDFTVTAEDHPVEPQKSGEFGLYTDKQWYRLQLTNPSFDQNNPTANLDISQLTAMVIEPILGIEDQRRDPRIDFVGGIRGLGELERRVDSGEMAAAFSIYPTQIEELFSVADADQVMPPKSTWFEPKLVDGLVSHLL